MASACRLQLQESFICTGDPSCGVGGTCEASGFCSFPDATCPSGRRYGDLGGLNSGQCVGSQSPDAGSGAPADARVCFGTAPFTFCFMTPPAGALDVSMATTFDTVGGTMTGIQLNCATPKSGDEGNNYCVLAANTITINAPLRATGTKPLVLLAVDSINVANNIDVGSHRMGTMDSNGAGAELTGSSRCNAGTPPGAATNGSGGGAGGSFLGAGGNGGVGGGGGSLGQHGLATTLGTVLRGGCPGQDGAGTGHGARGNGGGAVFLIAGNRITVGGMINAGGEGGAGAAANTADGGGGGGAGGLIGFDATTITVTGTLIANGGGGGEGSSNNSGNNGSDVSLTTAAPGGANGSGPGGNGGDGSSGAASGPGVVGQDGTNGGGGGGGGGGAGLIKGPPASLGTKLSPAATP